MLKKDVDLTVYAYETSRVLSNCGCLLVSGTMDKANVMTIGWGLIGRLWGKPVFMVAVRPSRYTFKFMEECSEFTVNIPKKGMEEIVKYCGTVSGRDENKFKAKGLTIVAGKKVKAPIIFECVINYECKIIYKTKFIPEDVPKDVIERWYPNNDFHTIYFGEIVAARADEDAISKLPI